MSDLSSSPAAGYAGWRSLVKHYQQPNLNKSLWQVSNSFGGFAFCLSLMVVSLQVGYWLTLLLALPAAGFLVRIFIIQHDCGHGSFFKARRANDLVGTACSFFTLVPYRFWRKSHAIHHAHHAELEERGIGDIWTMTVDEYIGASWWRRTVYRIFRNPLFLFGIAPTIHFVLMQRLPIGAPPGSRRDEKLSVWWTNGGLAVLVSLAGLLLGFDTVLCVYMPIIVIAASAGTWLFYVQHQFEHTYWEHTPDWDYTLAALHGSSYYKLPKVLQWFTGNIGFHHIHHLSPRIPNYHLQACHESHPLFQRVVHLDWRSSLQTAWLALWDEEQRRLVTFRAADQAWQARRKEAVVEAAGV